jgi:hypothetical protein
VEMLKHDIDEHYMEWEKNKANIEALYQEKGTKRQKNNLYVFKSSLFFRQKRKTIQLLIGIH